VRGVLGSGIVVARAFGVARSLGAAAVGRMVGREEVASTGCWIGAPDAGADDGGSWCVLGAGAASALSMGDWVAAGRIGATGAGPGTGGRKGSLGSVAGDDGGS
jgi:hypothetical protein